MKKTKIPILISVFTLTMLAQPYIPRASNFEIDLSRIYYQDGSGREIDDDFSQDTIDGDGVITISNSAVIQRPPSEAGTTYVWEPVYGNVQGNTLSQLVPGGPAVMSIPAADDTIPPIPTANITVDGNTADWASVDPHITDVNTMIDDCSVAGSDIDYVKLAYNQDKTRLYILIKTNTSNVNTNLWYRLFFDNDIDGHVGEPGDCQVDFEYAGVWDVVSQGWNSDDGDDWYPIDEQGEVAVSGYFIEGSVDVSSLGLPDDFHLYGRTMKGESPYNRYDRFDALKLEVKGACALGGIGVAEPSSDNWQFLARIDNFRNVDLDQPQHYYHVGIGGGTHAEVYEHTETQAVAPGAIIVDGNGSDWSGLSPALVDPQGDSTGGSGADIKHIYTAMDNTYAYIMVETYNTPINQNATIEINFNYKDGQHYTASSYDDLHTNIGNSDLYAWNDNDLDGNMESYPITGYTVVRGNVMEARIPLSQIENAAYFNPTYVNIWASGAQNGDDLSYVDPVNSPDICFTWFTGTYEGIYYNHALIFGAGIDQYGGTDGGWECDPIVLNGYDPSTTTIDLKLEIQNGNTMTGSYQINDGGWNQIAQHTITGNMPGFAELYPYVNLETGIESGPAFGDELAVDFGSNGLYHYDGSSWTKLSNWNPNDEGMENWQHGLAVDFGSNGLYNYDGSTWTRPSIWNPEGMEGWANGLAVDFGANGLYNYDGSNWTRLTGWNPEGDGMENWQHGLAVDFGANGLYNYDGSDWTKLTGWNPDGMEGWSNGLAVDFGSNGLYHYNGSSWTRLSSWNPEDMVSWSNGLAVDFGSNGLYNYDGSNWTRLTGWNPEGMGGWANGLAVDFGPNGCYNYDGSSWTKLSSWNPENGQAWGNDIAVDFGGNGLYSYDGANWTRLTGWNPEGMEDVDLN